MLETWEDILLPILTPYTANNDRENENTIESTYSEPTVKELKDVMNARPIDDGYAIRVGPMVLPLSLS